MEKGLVNATYTLRPTRQLEQALSLVVGRAGVRGWYGEQREEQTEAISRSNKRGDKTLIGENHIPRRGVRGSDLAEGNGRIINSWAQTIRRRMGERFDYGQSSNDA